MSKLISLIVPIYNVERYLINCINSIMSQTHIEIEIILVDDGSTDNSSYFSDSNILKDKRIIVIHCKNGGLSNARNIGLLLSSGDYVAFCDGDDWMENVILNNALQVIETNKSDVVIWGYSADFANNNKKMLPSKKYIPKRISLFKGNSNTELESPITIGFMGYVWNKLYRKDITERISFEKDISLVEDILFNKDIIIKSNRIDFINQIGTHYIQYNRETLGTKYYPNFFELKLRACNAKKEILINYGFKGEKLSNIDISNNYGVLEGTIRMISRTNHFSTIIERKQQLIDLFNSKEAKLILEQYKPKNIKEISIIACIKMKVYVLLIYIFRIRNIKNRCAY